MNEEKTAALIAQPTSGYADKAEIEARDQWQQTGLVPMEYVQGLLRQSFSNGETILERVLASIGHIGEAPPSSNRGT